MRRALHIILFGLLAAYAALTVNLVVEPTITRELLIAAALGLPAGLPVLIDRRLGLLTPVILVVGLYVLLRTVSPLPDDIASLGEQYSYYMQELRFGFSAYTEAVFPLVLTGAPGLTLLIAFWVYLICAGASVLALGGGRTLAGSAALIALLAFTMTVDGTHRELLLAAGFLVLVILVLVTAEAQSRRTWGLGDLAAGLLIGSVAVSLALLTLQTAPGVAQSGWEDWRNWRPFGGENRQVVFNWRQNYPRLLDPQNDFPVMRVASPVPSYWRANTLEVFTGDAWLSAGSFYEPLVEEDDGSAPVPSGGVLPPGEEVTQRFLLQGLSTTYLFVGGEPVRLHHESGGRVYTSGYGALRAEIPLQPPSGYDVTAVVPQVTPSELVGLGRDYPEDIAAEYLELPIPSAAEVARLEAAGENWQEIVAESSSRGEEFLGAYGLNEAILRGATDPYQVALRIERFLYNRYDYSLELPRSPLVSPFAAFLMDTRVGYCQQFAGSMALLLRMNGVPARVAVGFTTGEALEDDTYLVGTNNAHSWVEAYFPTKGWIPFDPTPGRELPGVGASSTTAGFEDPFPDEPLPEVDAPSAQAPLELPFGAGADPGTDPGQTGSGSENGFRAALAVAGLTMLLALWPAARRRWTARRVGAGTARRRLAASVSLMNAYLSDAGYAAGPASTLDETARVLEDLGVDADVLRRDAQRILYGGHRAGTPDVALVEETRGRMIHAVQRRKGWGWTVASWYGGPRLAQRLTEATGRWWGEDPPVVPAPRRRTANDTAS